MRVDPKKIKPNDGSFRGRYTAKRNVVVTPRPNGEFMCLNGHARVKHAVAIGLSEIEVDLASDEFVPPKA